MTIVVLMLNLVYVLINNVYIRYGIAVCFILLACAFVATELCSRTANFNRLWLPEWNTNTLASDDDLLWSPPIEVNPGWNITLRGREYPYAPARSANILRIITLGDSTTWGQGIKKFEDTYPGILNTALNQSDKGRQFEVLNFGIPGYSSFQGLLLLKKYVLKLSPAIITLRFYANDTSDNLKIGTILTDRECWMKLKSGDMKPSWFVLLQNKVPRYKVIADIKKVVLSAGAKLNLIKARKRVPVEEYIQNLKEIVKIARENNIKVFFIYETLATGYSLNDMINSNPYFQALRLVGREENIRLIDPITPFVERKHEALFFDEIHPTAMGHKMIAEQILKALTEEGFI